MRVVPVELSEANLLVARWHRHHQPVQGHRFSLGLLDEGGVFHGACVVGRPVARMAGDPRRVAEVTRLVTDGTRNGCSMLYAAAARACKGLGFERIQTYILDSETGTSLRAAGWVLERLTAGGEWAHPAGCRCSPYCIRHAGARTNTHPTTGKARWGLALNPAIPEPEQVLPDESGSAGLWDAPVLAAAEG
jgi:hypothetical protein